MIEYGWHDLAGALGVVLIVGAYLGLQLRRLDAEGLGYSVANAVGAGLVLASLTVDFNLSAAVIEGFWVLISLIGIVRAVRKRSRGSHPERVDSSQQRRV